MLSPNIDYKFDEMAELATELVKQGSTFHQKFTCGKCGRRLVVLKPNIMFRKGKCGRCGYTTNLSKRGCNLTVLVPGLVPDIGEGV